jgi:transcriptional regulator with XRE-family HTH domain
MVHSFAMPKRHVAIGEKMRRARLKRLGDRSLRTVARRLGVDHSIVSRWESGDVALRVADLFAYAEACGVTAEELVAGLTKRSAEQLVLELDPPVGRAVLRLVDVLKERRLKGATRRAM